MNHLNIKNIVILLLFTMFACNSEKQYEYKDEFKTYLRDIHHFKIDENLKKQTFLVLNLDCKACFPENFNLLLSEINIPETSKNYLFLCGSEAKSVNVSNFDASLYDKNKFERYKLGLAKVLIIHYDHKKFTAHGFTYFQKDTISKYINKFSNNK